MLGLFHSVCLGLGDPIQCSSWAVYNGLHPRFPHTALRRSGPTSQLYRVAPASPSTGHSPSLRIKTKPPAPQFFCFLRRRNMALPPANPGFRLGCQEAPSTGLALAPRLALLRPAAVSRHRFGISEVFDFCRLFCSYTESCPCSQLTR